MSNLKVNELVTGEVRLSYVNLLEPRAINGVGDPKYSVQLLIPKEDSATIAALKTAKAEAIRIGVKEGKKVFSDLNPAKVEKLNVFIKDGDSADYVDQPGFAGHWLLNASCPASTPPGIRDSRLQAIVNPTDIYSGMYARVHIQLFPYNKAGNVGIGVSLQNVMKTRDGDPLGGSRKRPEDVFADLGSPFEDAEADPLS